LRKNLMKKPKGVAGKSKNVAYEFWMVNTPPTFAGGFGAALTQLATINVVANRNAEINGYTMRWEELDVNGRYFYGDIVKLRMDLLPLKGGVNTKSSSLNLPQTEGISEAFAFLFDTNSNVLVTQYNHYGASVGGFISYLEQTITFGGAVDVLPIWTVAGLEKLQQMTDVRRIKYRIAKPKGLTLNPNAAGSVDSAITTMGDFDASTVEMVISSGLSHKSLTMREVLKKAKNLLTGQTAANVHVETFEVIGYSGDLRLRISTSASVRVWNC